MNKYILLISLLIVSGCASITGYHFEPESTKEAETLITYTVDEFENDSWLKSEAVVNLDHASAVYNFRARFGENKKLDFVQVYINLRFTDWYFINDAAMKNEKISLTEINRDVLSAGALHENVAVNISSETLDRMSMQDTKIKLKGSHGDYIFTVSKIMSKAFLNQLNLRKKI